jgi:GntR family transcriptional regulator
MDDIQAQLDNAIERIVVSIDRTLAVPLSVQLRGALEYGIATGDLPAGAQLPSVRVFAQRLQVSPVTVSGVYARLRTSGLVESRVGSGSFVTRNAPARIDVQDGQRALQMKIDELVAAAAELGIGPAELAFRVSSATSLRQRTLKVLMLGIFQEATVYYASVLRTHFPARDEIVATTFEALALDGLPDDIDVVVTPRNMRANAERLFPTVPVLGMTFIPTEQTRIELARISPDASVAVVSYFPDFLALMKAGIMRFAPHVTKTEAGVWNDAGIDGLLSRCQVMIHATGADMLRQRLKPGQSAIEYRHTPDPHVIRSELVPLMDTLRKRTKDMEQPREDSRLQLVRDRGLSEAG